MGFSSGAWNLVSSELIVDSLWGIVGLSTCSWNLNSSGPAGGSALGHCGVQFKLTGHGSPQDTCSFSFGVLWGSVLWFCFGSLWSSVQADGIWCSQDPIGLQFWGLVGCSSS